MAHRHGQQDGTVKTLVAAKPEGSGRTTGIGGPAARRVRRAERSPLLPLLVAAAPPVARGHLRRGGRTARHRGSYRPPRFTVGPTTPPTPSASASPPPTPRRSPGPSAPSPNSPASAPEDLVTD
ncbi:hypothetical protein ACRAWF_03100 [Streptomyces sp. L7]